MFNKLKDPSESESYCQIVTVDKSLTKKPVKATEHPKEHYKLWPPPLHHIDVSGKKEDKFPTNCQEWNKYKSALGWSINDIKGQNE